MKIVVKPMPVLVQEYYKNKAFMGSYFCEQDFSSRMVDSNPLTSHWHHPTPGIVYVIQFLEGEYKGLCKIGFTANWEERQKPLRRKYGQFITIHTATSNNARVAESWFHWRYNEFAQGGEIFWIPSYLFPKIRKVTEIIAVPRTRESFVKWRRCFYRTLVDNKYTSWGDPSQSLANGHIPAGYHDALDYYGMSDIDAF